MRRGSNHEGEAAVIRRRQVYPDDSGVVTREALLEAMIDAATFLDFAGGVLSVVTQRQPTGLPGEMVTTGAVVEWRHDARVQPRPEQFEQPTSQTGEPPELPDRPRIVPMSAGQIMREAEASVALDGDTQPVPEAEDAPEEPDGFDYSRLDEEDVEEPVATP
jgi:hypothetical protein